ncbi:MAG: hypothetical protein ACRDE2_03410 [Chitinophagaceae bacterium]
MLSTNDVTGVYETILSIPGMDEPVKIDFKVSRRNILLLHSVIERGLSDKEDKKSIHLLDIVPEETLQELREFSESCIQKAGLVALKEKLQALSVSK